MTEPSPKDLAKAMAPREPVRTAAPLSRTYRAALWLLKAGRFPGWVRGARALLTLAGWDGKRKTVKVADLMEAAETLDERRGEGSGEGRG